MAFKRSAVRSRLPPPNKNTTFRSFFYLVGIVGAKRVKAVRQASDRQTRVCRCDFSRRSETERDPFKKWELPPRLPPPNKNSL